MAKKRLDIRGVMIPNAYKWYYDWFGEESTCPKDVQDVIDQLQEDDELEVYINSPGGVINVGSEIYSLLRNIRDKVTIIITGEACSAASVVAMAAHCIMSPTALLMVHCVSTSARGNRSDMEHTAEVLRAADQALCTAYMEKTGMSEEEALDMMEKETWLTAKQAKELGLVDEIMFEEEEEGQLMMAGPMFLLPSKEKMEKVKAMMQAGDPKEDTTILMQQFELLKLKGVEK